MAGFNELTASEYEGIWNSPEAIQSRLTIKSRQNYYDGIHAIVNSNRTSVDGNSKSERVANFIKYGIDMYVGSIVGDPISVTASEVDDGEEVNESPSVYREIAKDNSFDTTDVTNTRNAYIAGYGIETHEYDSGANAYVITAQNPIQWHIVFDSNSGLLGAIHMSKVDAGQFYQGALLKNDLDIMVVFTDKDIITFHKMADTKDGKWYEPESAPRSPHQFGAPPVVVWNINDGYESHITDDLIGQQDEYNEADSDSGDGLKFDTDGILAIKGYSIAEVKEASETLRQWKMFPLPADGDIKFVAKNTDFARIESRIARTREHIFTALGVPDIEEIVGATGDTSGIALGLKFKPMQDNAKSMIAYLRAGVRKRIDLINTVKRATGGAIEDVQVNITFDLPVNRVEQWQNIGSVTGVVSHTKQLEMLDDVHDPDQELKRLDAERENTGFIDRNNLSPEALTVQNDREIEQQSLELAPKIDAAIQAIADAATANLNKQISKQPKAPDA